jgi:hypothetical protein
VRGGAQRALDLGQHTLDIGQDVVVPKAKNPIAVSGDAGIKGRGILMLLRQDKDHVVSS